MTKPLKVFGGCFDGYNRVIVAAKSHAEAIRFWQQMGGYSLSEYYARLHSTQTGNKEEIEIAMAHPRQIFTAPLNSYPQKFKPVKK